MLKVTVVGIDRSGVGSSHAVYVVDLEDGRRCVARFANLPSTTSPSKSGADVSGESFLHLDVRSDNLCFDGPRSLLVDWNLAAISNPRIELIGWLPSLSVEAGPPPDQFTGPDDAPFAVITAGHFAFAGLPPSSPTSRARISQLTQLKPSLPWACRLVGLDPPDPVAP